MAKLPYFKVYPGDDMQSPVFGCSLAAQGLYERMRYIAHNGSPRYGFLENASGGLASSVIAARCGCQLSNFQNTFQELLSAGAIHCDEKGIVYFPELVEQQKQRDADAARKNKSRHDKTMPLALGADPPEHPPNVTPPVTPPSVSLSVKQQQTTTAPPAAAVGNSLALKNSTKNYAKQAATDEDWRDVDHWRAILMRAGWANDGLLSALIKLGKQRVKLASQPDLEAYKFLAQGINAVTDPVVRNRYRVVHSGGYNPNEYELAQAKRALFNERNKAAQAAGGPKKLAAVLAAGE